MRSAFVFAVLALTACATLSRGERLAESTMGCVQGVLKEKVPEGAPDGQAHCLAAGMIARHCSLAEAYVASIGKELGDVFGPGRAQWSDWIADRKGIRCAHSTQTDERLQRCCER